VSRASGRRDWGGEGQDRDRVRQWPQETGEPQEGPAQQAAGPHQEGEGPEEAWRGQGGRVAQTHPGRVTPQPARRDTRAQQADGDLAFANHCLRRPASGQVEEEQGAASRRNRTQLPDRGLGRVLADQVAHEGGRGRDLPQDPGTRKAAAQPDRREQPEQGNPAAQEAGGQHPPAHSRDQGESLLYQRRDRRLRPAHQRVAQADRGQHAGRQGGDQQDPGGTGQAGREHEAEAAGEGQGGGPLQGLQESARLVEGGEEERGLYQAHHRVAEEERGEGEAVPGAGEGTQTQPDERAWDADCAGQPGQGAAAGDQAHLGQESRHEDGDYSALRQAQALRLAHHQGRHRPHSRLARLNN